MNRIIALDPGNEHTAWCVVDGGRPVLFGKEPNREVLNRVRNDWHPLEEGYHLAIEMVASYGMPVGREVFETCLWIGRFAEAWERRLGKCQLVYRKEVKLFHCESVRATDANIRASLVDRFGPGKDKAIGKKKAPGPLYGLSGDCWSAFAIGVMVHGRASAQAGA